MAANEIYELASDFELASSEVAPIMRKAFQSSAEKVRNEWRKGVREKAPAHLPHLPAAITYETRALATSVIAEIGPEAGRTQGALGRGEEFGSVNQPPHLSGLNAMISEEGPLETSVSADLRKAMP